MLKKSLLASSYFKLLCVCMLFAACGDRVHETGNGTITEETRNVGAFFKLDIEGNYDIVLQEGSNPLVTIQTDENLHQYIETSLDGQTLKVRNIENVEPTEGTKLIITYQRIEQIKLGGAAKLSNRGILNTDELNLRVEGAGVVNLNLQAQELELRLAGAGSISLRGSVGTQQLVLSGAGNLAAYELQSKACEIELSGVGSAQVNVTDNLVARLSGVGVIRFTGDPRNIQREVTGLGDIERADN